MRRKLTDRRTRLIIERNNRPGETTPRGSQSGSGEASVPARSEPYPFLTRARRGALGPYETRYSITRGYPETPPAP